MRIRTLVTTLGLGLVLGAGARPAHAFSDEVIKAHIPFAFHVYGIALPAGDYVIRQADMLSPGLLLIQKTDDSASTFFLTENAVPKPAIGHSELVFDRYGQERFLHAIWVPGDDAGARLMPSSWEIQAARSAVVAPGKTRPVAQSTQQR
jgi:hypothetical protein